MKTPKAAAVLLFFSLQANAEILDHDEMLNAMDCVIGLGSELIYAIRDYNEKFKRGLEERILRVRTDLLETMEGRAINPEDWLKLNQQRQKIAVSTIENAGPDKYAEITYSICRNLGY